MATRLLYLFLFALIFSGVSSRRVHMPIAPAPRPAEGFGIVKEFGGLSCYTTGYPASRHAVIIISDASGYGTPRLREIADKIGDVGFYVVVPDFFKGDPLKPKAPFAPWFNKHTPQLVYKSALPIVEALKSEGATKIGAAGFGWGGKIAANLLNHPDVQAGVLIHPTHTSVNDIKKITAPVAILSGEHDKMTPPQLLQQFKVILEAKPEVDSFVKMYPEVGGGWTVMLDETNPVTEKSADRALTDTLNWFMQHLKVRRQ